MRVQSSPGLVKRTTRAAHRFSGGESIRSLVNRAKPTLRHFRDRSNEAVRTEGKRRTARSRRLRVTGIVATLSVLGTVWSYAWPAPPVSAPPPRVVTAKRGWSWGGGFLRYWQRVELPSYRIEEVLLDFRVATINEEQHSWQGFDFGSVCYRVSLWFLSACLISFTFVALGVASAVRSTRRAARNLCVACGYDLRGCEENRCSECGHAFERAELGDAS